MGLLKKFTEVRKVFAVGSQKNFVRHLHGLKYILEVIKILEMNGPRWLRSFWRGRTKKWPFLI